MGTGDVNSGTLMWHDSGLYWEIYCKQREDGHSYVASLDSSGSRMAEKIDQLVTSKGDDMSVHYCFVHNSLIRGNCIFLGMKLRLHVLVLLIRMRIVLTWQSCSRSPDKSADNAVWMQFNKRAMWDVFRFGTWGRFMRLRCCEIKESEGDHLLCEDVLNGVCENLNNVCLRSGEKKRVGSPYSLERAVNGEYNLQSNDLCESLEEEVLNIDELGDQNNYVNVNGQSSNYEIPHLSNNDDVYEEVHYEEVGYPDRRAHEPVEEEVYAWERNSKDMQELKLDDSTRASDTVVCNDHMMHKNSYAGGAYELESASSVYVDMRVTSKVDVRGSNEMDNVVTDDHIQDVEQKEENIYVAPCIYANAQELDREVSPIYTCVNKCGTNNSTIQMDDHDCIDIDSNVQKSVHDKGPYDDLPPTPPPLRSATSNVAAQNDSIRASGDYDFIHDVCDDNIQQSNAQSRDPCADRCAGSTGNDDTPPPPPPPRPVLNSMKGDVANASEGTRMSLFQLVRNLLGIKKT